MGKASRRAGRRQRLGRSRMSISPGATGLRLVVATSPIDARDGAFLEHDLQMVRAALLYADTVELVSPIANMIGRIAAMQTADSHAWLDVLLQMDDDVLARYSRDQEPAEYREQLRLSRQMLSMPRPQRRKLPAGQRKQLHALRASYEQVIASPDGLQETLQRTLEQSGARELGEALESGALVVNWAEDMMETFVDHLGTLLGSPDTHLLLDAKTAGLARAMIDEGQVSPAELTLSRAARSRVGTGLVANLPAFPDARITTILEARAELAEPLSAYRKGVTQISEKLHSGPFDPPIESEVDDIWRDAVRPTVDTLRADLSKTRLAREAAVNLGLDVKTLLTGAGLFFGVQSLTDVEELAAAGLSATPVLGRAVASAVKESVGRREAARRHEFFYLLELDRML